MTKPILTQVLRCKRGHLEMATKFANNCKQSVFNFLNIYQRILPVKNWIIKIASLLLVIWMRLEFFIWIGHMKLWLLVVTVLFSVPSIDFTKGPSRLWSKHEWFWKAPPGAKPIIGVNLNPQRKTKTPTTHARRTNPPMNFDIFQRYSELMRDNWRAPYCNGPVG